MVSEGLKRATRVVNVLARHGLGYFVHRFGLRWHLPFIDRLFAVHASVPDSVPVRVRVAMEALGGAYVKLGQLLSLRPDLVPLEYCEEFKKLLDSASPVSFEEVKCVVEQELKQPLSAVFESFSQRPLGSASVAQVHRAVLKSGGVVVVKVLRPGVAQEFKADIEIMYYFARKMQQHLKNVFSPVQIVEEFEKYTCQELDFLVEARHLERFHQLFAKYPKIVVPRVHWRETAHSVLVMEYLDGVKLSDIGSLPKTVDRKSLACQILDVCLAQVFELGVFHADIHPGNVLLLPRGRIGLLDFGIVGELDQKYVSLGIELFVALAQKDAGRVARILLQTGVPSVEVDVDAFQDDVEKIVDEWYASTHHVNSMRITQMMLVLFEACVRRRIKMPRDVILLGKALVTAEGTALFVYPDIDFVEYARPKIALLKKRSVRVIAGNVLARGREFTEAVWDIPKQTVMLMEHLSRGTIRVGVADSDIKHLGLDISMSSNRISYSLLISALIIAGTLLADVGPAVVPGYSFASLASFFAAGILLVPFLVSVWLEGGSKRDAHVEYVK